MSVLEGSIQLRTETAAFYTVNNPILLDGQIGIETDGLLTTPKFKIGDGVTAWNTLPYATSASFASQLQNLFFASPDGVSGTPTFRSIVANDLPQIIKVTEIDEIDSGGNITIVSNTIDDNNNHPVYVQGLSAPTLALFDLANSKSCFIKYLAGQMTFSVNWSGKVGAGGTGGSTGLTISSVRTQVPTRLDVDNVQSISSSTLLTLIAITDAGSSIRAVFISGATTPALAIYNSSISKTIYIGQNASGNLIFNLNNTGKTTSGGTANYLSLLTSGTIKYADGNQGVGKVLGDDGTGTGIVKWITPSGSGASWGSITGTLSSQTDLQTALDLKAAITDLPKSSDTVRYASTKRGQNYIANGAGVFVTSGGYNGVLIAFPYVIGKTHTVTGIEVEVVTATAGGKARLSLYNDNSGVPGTLIEYAGEADCSTTGVKTITFASQRQLLASSQIAWMAFEVNSAAVQVRYIANPINVLPWNSAATTGTSNVYTVAQAYGSSPSPFTAGAFKTTSGWAVDVRLVSLST